MSGISDDGLEAYKAIVVGRSGVGKSTILVRFLEDKFIRQGPTIGMDVQTKEVQFKDSRFKLELWDTAGQERFHTIVKRYYSLSKAVCAVFDISDETSLDDAKNWLEEIIQSCGTELPILLLGNKCDKLQPAELNETLSRFNEKIERLKNQYHCEFHVVSGLTGENVRKVFDRLSQLIYEHYIKKKLGGNSQVQVGFKLDQVSKKEYSRKKSCC